MNLILAATEKELEFVSSKNCSAVGIGMVTAGIGTYEALLNSPETTFVTFIGSCGVSSDLELLKCYYSQCAFIHQPGYMPDAMRSKWSSKEKTVISNATRLDAFRSANTISTEAPLKTAENMEIAAVAAVCNHLNVGWCILSCATNHIGENAHSEWVSNHQKAAKITAELLLLT